jgi:hypothetical protein
MTSTRTSDPVLYVDRRDPGGEPGALVAAWLWGELLDVPAVAVAETGPDTLAVRADPGAMDGVRHRVQDLLTQPRFVCWRLRPA